MKVALARLKLLSISLIVIGLMFVGNTYAEINFNDCVAMLLFDDGGGTDAEDSSGMDNHGIIHGDAKWVDGKFGKALSLDGSDDYVLIEHDESLNVGEEHTIAFWCKLSKVPADGMAVITKDDWAPGFWWDSGKIRHHTHDPPGKLHFIDAVWKPDTDWHHIAVTWDGDEFGVYLDASSIGSGITTRDLGRNPLTEKPLIFGIYLPTGQHAQWGKFFSGIVDELVIFNTALPEGEIESIMNNGLQSAADVKPTDKLATTWATIKDN